MQKRMLINVKHAGLARESDFCDRKPWRSVLWHAVTLGGIEPAALNPQTQHDEGVAG